MATGKMLLHASPTSPFVRKVRIAIDVLGLADSIEIVPTDTGNPDPAFFERNPLGKIPTLITETGEHIFDSAVIADYLNDRAGGGIIPDGPARWQTLTREALADGICDAALLQVYEVRMRPEERRHQPWVDRQAEKVARGLARLEAETTPFSGKPDIGDIATAAMLGYLDLRFENDWRPAHPKLAAWLADFVAAVPAFAATDPSAA